jgi:hypothetical protein
MAGKAYSMATPYWIGVVRCLTRFGMKTTSSGYSLMPAQCAARTAWSFLRLGFMKHVALWQQLE